MQITLLISHAETVLLSMTMLRLSTRLGPRRPPASNTRQRTTHEAPNMSTTRRTVRGFPGLMRASVCPHPLPLLQI